MPTAGAIFRAFLGLGCIGFGGPMAHLALFRRAFVEQRGWIDADRYDALVALAQLVPGPASSQVGFALGLQWAGWRGALAAFAGFTLPSALLMGGLGSGLVLIEGDAATAVIRGLMLVAIAVVAQAMVGMVRAVGPQPAPLAAAVLVGACALFVPLGVAVWLCLLAAAAIGAANPGWLERKTIALPLRGPRGRGAAVGLGVLGVLLLATALPAMLGADPVMPPAFHVAAAHLQAGALVFGGGHVVLPLLQSGLVVPGWVTPSEFAAGYGAAQALPGPMFALSAYFGALAQPGSWAWLSALLSLGAMFFSGFVLIVAAQAHAQRWWSNRRGLAALGMVHGGVIGLLGAAWWGLVRDASLPAIDLPILLLCFLLLARTPRSALVVVLLGVGYSLAMAGRGA